MKKIIILAFLMAISCSNSDKFSGEKSLEIRIEGIPYIIRGKELSLFASIHPDSDYLMDYFWIINGDTTHSDTHIIDYGEHIVKLVVVDIFGDSVTDSILIYLPMQIEVELFSPIDGFSDFLETDTLKFQYKTSGAENHFLYVSTDEKTLWEEENILASEILEPPLSDIYFWGIKAFTEKDTVFSKKRCIGKYC
ncbi:MAG: hypothetical protein FWC26_15395 [Fibromonadales bacterium]|nr:hypothetical protein [Fibromonadales bacterium]